MINKVLLSLSIALSGVGYAQTYTTSPFSSNGLGEEGGLVDPQFGGLGNASAAFVDSASVNLNNPASYSALSKGQPLFSFGLSSRLSDYSQNGSSYKGRVVGLNQIALVLPLNDRCGMALALTPFSKKGYNTEVQSSLNFEGDSVRTQYLGYGSIQQIVVGFSGLVLKKQKHEIRVGINAAYVFGTVTNERRSFLSGSSGAGGVDFTSYRVRSGMVNLGVSYRAQLTKDNSQHLTLGLIVSPGQTLAANRDYEFYYAGTIGTRSSYDTLEFVNDDKGKIHFPVTTSFGFNYEFRPNKSAESRKNPQLNVIGEFKMRQWENYRTAFTNENLTNQFANATALSLGVQFIPNSDVSLKTKGFNYANRVRYRIGVVQNRLPFKELGTQLVENSITAGIGLPVTSQRTNSSFNISFQYGNRTSGLVGGLKENFVSLNMGIILAPSSYDKWFKKYKLD